MATQASARGDAAREEGNKALNRTIIFGFGRSQKYEDAAEHFKTAGNAYKLANLWQSAGDAFLQAADAYLKADASSGNEATSAVVEAAQSYKKINPSDAVSAYRRAIDMYNETGRFGMSSRYCKELAEVYEADNNIEAAEAAYQEAADLFINDNKSSNANQCLLKVAVMSSERGELMKACQIFEKIGKESMTSRLGAYSAKGYFFQALMCMLAMGDNVAVGIKLQSYKEIDHTFNGSRECDFIEKLVKVHIYFKNALSRMLACIQVNFYV
jgi:alpha-soluble NSF attachment protein